MSDETLPQTEQQTTPQQQVPQTTRGEVGRPNGRTDRMLRLKRMTPTQRREHRRTWKAAQRKAAQAARQKASAERAAKAPKAAAGGKK